MVYDMETLMILMGIVGFSSFCIIVKEESDRIIEFIRKVVND